MNKVLLPARLEVQGTNPVSAVTLSLLEPEKQVKSPVSHPIDIYAPLLSGLSSSPDPSRCLQHPSGTPFFSKDVPSSWTFQVASISGVR